MLAPPSTTRVCPVMYEERSEIKNKIAAAISAGIALRRSGGTFAHACLAALVSNSHHGGCQRQPGCDTVGPNVPWPEFLRKRLDPADHPGFGGSVGTPMRCGVEATHRRDEHHCSATLLRHHAPEFLRKKIDLAEIEQHLIVENFILDVEDILS